MKGKKMAAIGAAAVFLLGAFAGCEKEYKTDDARQIAMREFDLDEVLAVTVGGLEQFEPPGKVYRFHFYVLGKKGDEELFIIVPDSSANTPYRAE